jgi:uncharacterized protein (TIGR00369 family)
VSKETESLQREWLEAARAVRDKAQAPDVLPMSAFKECSGLELFQRMMRGELPPAPIAHVLDFSLVEADKGRIVFQGHPHKNFYNPAGTIHGGWQATLLDSCMSCAVQTMLERGQAYTTLEMKINFVRAMTDRVGPVRAEGTVIQVGRQIGIAEGKLYDAAGKLYAHGTTTCLIFDMQEMKR